MREEKRVQDAGQLLQQGFVAQRDGDVVNAIELYRRSLATYPTPEAHTCLGSAYSEQGRFDDAILECESAIAIDPEFGTPYNDIGSYLIEKGRYDEALPYLQKALKVRRYEHPHHTHFNMARVFAQRGMMLKAAEEFREALKIEPNFRAAAEGLITITQSLN